MFIPDKLYEQIIQHTVIATVDLVIMDSDKHILLCKRSNRPLKWQYYLPGGRINKNETMIQATHRKAKQELGLEIDTDRLIFVWVYDDIFSDSEFGDASTHCIPVTFTYQLEPEEQYLIQWDNQHSDMGFFSCDDDIIDSFLKKRLEDIQAQYSIL